MDKGGQIGEKCDCSSQIKRGILVVEGSVTHREMGGGGAIEDRCALQMGLMAEDMRCDRLF